MPKKDIVTDKVDYVGDVLSEWLITHYADDPDVEVSPTSDGGVNGGAVVRIKGRVFWVIVSERPDGSLTGKMMTDDLSRGVAKRTKNPKNLIPWAQAEIEKWKAR